MFCEISGPLSHVAYTERSTIVDLLIKIPGPLNHNFFKRSEIFFFFFFFNFVYLPWGTSAETGFH